MLTSSLPRVANQFWENIKNGNPEAAYDLTNTGFKSETSFEDFEAGMETFLLENYEDVSWTNRSVKSDGSGELEGTISPFFLFAIISPFFKIRNWSFYNFPSVPFEFV